MSEFLTTPDMRDMLHEDLETYFDQPMTSYQAEVARKMPELPIESVLRKGDFYEETRGHFLDVIEKSEEVQ